MLTARKEEKKARAMDPNITKAKEMMSISPHLSEQQAAAPTMPSANKWEELRGLPFAEKLRHSSTAKHVAMAVKQERHAKAHGAPPQCELEAALLDTSALSTERITRNIEEAEKTAKAAKAQHELALSLGKAYLELEAKFTEAARELLKDERKAYKKIEQQSHADIMAIAADGADRAAPIRRAPREFAALRPSAECFVCAALVQGSEFQQHVATCVSNRGQSFYNRFVQANVTLEGCHTECLREIALMQATEMATIVKAEQTRKEEERTRRAEEKKHLAALKEAEGALTKELATATDKLDEEVATYTLAGVGSSEGPQQGSQRSGS